MTKITATILQRLITDILEDEKDLAVERQHPNAVKKAFDKKAKALF